MTCMRTTIFMLMLGLVSAIGPGAAIASDKPEKEKPVCATDFETADKLGLYDALQRNSLLEVVDGEGVDGSKALRATYKGYNRGSQRITAQFELPKHLDEATLVFDVKFAKGFQFVKGGKLHGLAPDNSITGGKKMAPEGWSARAMWKPKGLSSYIYCQNKKGQWGQEPDRTIDFNFKTERYYSICIHVKLNDPVKKANGSVRIYVNGKGVAEDRGVQFRSVDGEHTKISRLLFSTFHGGHSPDWAPKDKNGNYTEVYADFDNFAVYEGLHVRKKPGE